MKMGRPLWSFPERWCCWTSQTRWSDYCFLSTAHISRAVSVSVRGRKDLRARSDTSRNRRRDNLRTQRRSSMRHQEAFWVKLVCHTLCNMNSANTRSHSTWSWWANPAGSRWEFNIHWSLSEGKSGWNGHYAWTIYKSAEWGDQRGYSKVWSGPRGMYIRPWSYPGPERIYPALPCAYKGPCWGHHCAGEMDPVHSPSVPRSEVIDNYSKRGWWDLWLLGSGSDCCWTAESGTTRQKLLSLSFDHACIIEGLLNEDLDYLELNRYEIRAGNP